MHLLIIALRSRPQSRDPIYFCPERRSELFFVRSTCRAIRFFAGCGRTFCSRWPNWREFEIETTALPRDMIREEAAAMTGAIESTGDIEALFARYAEAFAARDAKVLAQCFLFPCHFVGDDGDDIALTVVTSVEQYLAEIVKPLFSGYRRLGVASGPIRDLQVRALSPRLRHVTVLWDVLNSPGEVLFSHEASYTLALRSREWRICAIAYSEMREINTLLASMPRA
jgi:hypothetical protein